jgi:hypothetical protein
MEIISFYAISWGGVFVLLASINLLPRLKKPAERVALQARKVSKHVIFQAAKLLTNRHVVHRHTFLGPWTVASILLHAAYVTVNLVCVVLWAPSASAAARRAGYLSILNALPLFVGTHLGFAADLLGLSLRLSRKIHRSAGLVSFGLLVFHVFGTVVDRSSSVLSVIQNIYNLMVQPFLIQNHESLTTM